MRGNAPPNDWGFFKKTGIYPLNINKIFGNCTTKIDKDEYDQLLTQVEPLTDVFKEQGELFDGDYDAVGIWTGPKKDDRCISEKRNAILTYRDFDDREATTRSWKKIKLAEASARKAVRQNGRHLGLNSLILAFEV